MILLTMFLLAVDAPKFEAITTQATRTGELVAVGAGWSATVGSHAIPSGALVELTQIGVSRPAAPTDRSFIRLANGDLWPARIVSLLDDKLRISADFGIQQDMVLPVSSVAAIHWKAPKSN